MKAFQLDETRKVDWDMLVLRAPYFSMLQSWDWGRYKEMLGWKAFRVAVEDNQKIIAGADILIRKFPLDFISIAHIPRGPIGDWLNPEVNKLLFKEIHAIAKSNRAFCLKIEPALQHSPENILAIRRIGFIPSVITNQPRSTIIMDLQPPCEELFAKLRKQTRRKLLASQKKGLTVRKGTLEDLPGFYRLLRETAKRARFPPRTYDFYKKEFSTFFNKDNALFLLGCLKDRVLAANISYSFGSHAAFFYQASADDCGNLNINTLMTWEQIKLFKEKGCMTFDLWGIPDQVGLSYCQTGELLKPNRTDGLWGVYKFKSGFSENVVCYVGAYDYIYKPQAYKLITRLFNRNTLERAKTLFDRLSYV